jgi:hypothetical protein
MIAELGRVLVRKPFRQGVGQASRDLCAEILRDSRTKKRLMRGRTPPRKALTRAMTSGENP